MDNDFKRPTGSAPASPASTSSTSPTSPSPVVTPPRHDFTPPTDKVKKKRSGAMRELFSTIGILFTALLVALLMIMFVFRSYQVDGPSMQNTLQNSDKLIIWKVPRTWSRITGHQYVPKRGDIIVFTESGLSQFGQDDTKQLIKRVIGLPGDRVVVSNGNYMIYNSAHPKGFDPDKTLAYGKNIPTTSGDLNVTLGKNQLFVSGDNRPDSLDSRAFGPINTSQVIGKLVLRVFPINTAQAILAQASPWVWYIYRMSEMAKKTAKRGLGRGFETLLPPDFDKAKLLLAADDRIERVDVAKLQPNPYQPRKHFDQTALEELASSIKQYGIVQPLVVSPANNGHYTLIAGERRWRAAQLAGLAQVPCIIRTSEQLEQLEVAILENVQRVDLTPLEQAVSIERWHEQFSIAYDTIAKRLGKASSTVNNIVRLLQLPEAARDALAEGRISEGHARAILSLKDQPALQAHLLEAIQKQGWSVRQAERYVTSIKSGVQDQAKVAERVQTENPATKQLSKNSVRQSTFVAPPKAAG